MKKVNILLVDNYDSFTYNVYQYLGELGASITVWRNDSFNFKDVDRLAPDGIVISPGPSRPENAGKTVSVVKKYAGKIPMLGICLGHQAIAFAYGAKIVRARKVMHGKTSEIFHDGRGVFRRLRNPFLATRYHSLIVQEKSLSKDFEVSARTIDGEIMGIRHKKFPLEGVQFHPESILTEDGKLILENFLTITRKGGEK